VSPIVVEVIVEVAAMRLGQRTVNIRGQQAAHASAVHPGLPKQSIVLIIHTRQPESHTMDMKRINAGKLRAIGYDAKGRILRVEFDDGSAIDYANVGTDLWKRFSTSGAAWSFYRDNIEEEFAGTRGRAAVAGQRAELDALFGGAEAPKKPNPLDALFKAPDEE
jgi:hypothetical protein